MIRALSESNQRATHVFGEAAARLSKRSRPAAVYRIQLGADFPFDRATGLVPYLHELGVSHLYTSPYLRAAPASSHGYDVMAHDEISAELGGAEALKRLSDALRQSGMGHILDFVPNHMGIGKENALWQDVLENGPSSIYAPFFDIIWKPVKDELENKILLPVLGDQYGAVLEAGELVLEFSQGTFTIRYYDHSFPINPRHYPLILRHGIEDLEEKLGPEDPALEELLSIATGCDNLPPRTETELEKVTERRREKEVIKRRLDALSQSSPQIRSFLQRNVRTFNGERDDPRSFDLLDVLLGQQAYRLAHWRVAGEEINYRRFFDINDLAAIRMEDPEVFAETHRLTLELVAKGIAQGLRIDHPDGLYDPKAYFQRLQEETFLGVCREISVECGADFDELEPLLRGLYDRRVTKRSELSRATYVIAEKILGSDEHLPESWAIDGTTGYEFLNSLNGLFVVRENQKAIEEVFVRFTGLRLDLGELLYQKKKLIMSTSMASEVNILAYQLNRASELNRRSRDFTLNSLRSAIIEYVANFPVYRSYVTEEGVDDRDRRYIEQAIARAKRRSPVVNVSVFEFLRSIVLLRQGAELSPEEREQRLQFAMKLQQLTGPVMAKGLEDTCFYIYNRLVSLNEVGGDPRRFGTTVSEFHSRNAERLATSRGSLLATTTHDTKRSEDVRARINVLSELPREWKGVLSRLAKAARRHRIQVAEDRIAPDRNEQIMLFQNLIGAWPFGELDPPAREEFADRIAAYLLKAAKEAKINTSWINPDVAWDEALGTFVHRILRDEGFVRELLPFQRRVAEIGIYNSLSQTALKLASPGVPDLYQGCERWCFSLVDPDNRRPVDFSALAEGLGELHAQWAEGKGQHVELVRQLWAAREDGRIKQYITWRSLSLRASQPRLFLDGEYVPVEGAGPRSTNAVAFARRRGTQQAIVVAPRLVANLLEEQETGADPWEGTYLVLPGGSGGPAWRCAFTGVIHRTEYLRKSAILSLSSLFRELPLALLHPAS